MTAPVLAVSGLSKKYSRRLDRALAYGLRDIGRELFPARGRPLRDGEFWALEDISFAVAPGEAVAVVGHNGAGKSTLLKLLTGLLKPDRGTIEIRGRTEALIELGTGFNPALTGRENLRVVAALHGLTGRAVDALIDEVIAFAELDAFLDMPVQSYSSGMKSRLGYAMTAHLKPDILLVDEVLAVGDVEFQRKCLAHMHNYVAAGGSLLLVSHNVHQIQAVCTRGVLLDRGRLAFAGTAVETLNRMFESRPVRKPEAPKASSVGVAGIAVEEVLVEGLNGAEIRTDDPVRITVRYRCDAPVDAWWGFGIWTQDQWICVTGDLDETARTLEPGPGELSCTLPRLPLLAGNYLVRTAILDPATRMPLTTGGWDDNGVPLVVVAPPSALGNAQSKNNQLVKCDVAWE